MNKDVKLAAKYLAQTLGDDAAAVVICSFIEALQELVQDKEYFELRSFKLIFNDFFEKELLKDTISFGTLVKPLQN